MKSIKKFVMGKSGIGLLTGVFLCFVFLSSLVSAFGVSAPNSVEVYPGQTVESAYLISNVNSGEDVIVQVVMEDDAGISEFVDSDLVYDLPVGTTAEAKVSISIPVGTPIGTTYMIKAYFSQIAGLGEPGGVEIINNLRSGLAVVVVEKPAVPESEVVETPESTGVSVWIWIIVVVLVIVVIVFFIMKGKKNNSESK